MATTHEMQGDEAWAWPCPYCRTSNALEAAVCVSCGAQLRDPEEDDLFTTVATDNAQMVDPDAPRIRESLWSTEALPDEVVAEEVIEVTAPPPDPARDVGAPQAGPSGPFSANAPSAAERQHSHQQMFGAGAAPSEPQRFDEAQSGVSAGGPFGVSGAAQPVAPVAPQPAPQAASPPPAPPVVPPQPGADPFAQQRQAEPAGPRPTPDEHGLSIAVESLDPTDRDRCDTPIAVCGALLGEQEVVLGLVAGHLLGHSAVIAMTNTRILVANARRWKPLVDQFLPTADLMVHLRHDRDVASITFVQGDRLTGVDDISDVTAAVDLADRIRATAARAAAH